MRYSRTLRDAAGAAAQRRTYAYYRDRSPRPPRRRRKSAAEAREAFKAMLEAGRGPR